MVGKVNRRLFHRGVRRGAQRMETHEDGIKRKKIERQFMPRLHYSSAKKH